MESNLGLPVGEKITILSFAKEQNGKRKCATISERIKKDNNNYKLKLRYILEADFQKIVSKI
jgi:hypothetical protein